MSFLTKIFGDGKKEMVAKYWPIVEQINQLEKELEEIMAKKGEAAREGDLRENAAYQMASEDADTWRARIIDVEKILSDLEVQKGEK